MEYFYYVPFCNVFASRDILHKQAAQCFLRLDQTFADGDALKNDLGRIDAWWQGLNDEQRVDYDAERGSYPPVNEESIVSKLWRIHLRPWRPGAGNRVAKMSPEERRREREQLRERFGF